MTWTQLFDVSTGIALCLLAQKFIGMWRDGRLFGHDDDDIDELLRQERASRRWRDRCR